MMRFSAFAVLLFLLQLTACKNKPNALFTEMDQEATGVNFQNTLFEDGPLNVTNYIYFYNGGGVAIGDINNDGLQDILFTGNMVRNRLYLNKGAFQFEDITPKAGVDQKQGWCTGATMADVNGDGWLDIYICRSADINPAMRKNLLYINNGPLPSSNGEGRGEVTFTEKGEEYGLADPGYSTQASFFDYDKDGDLDCFIINHSLQKYSTGAMNSPELRRQTAPDFASKLYRNEDGHFSDVTDAAGITSNVFTFGLGLAVSDLNNDGWPDIYVSNDFNEQDYLFINNRNGTFKEALADCMDQTSLYSMGSDAADYNNDGLVDLATFDMMPEDNKTIKMHSGAENFDKFQYLFSKGFFYQYSRNMLQRNNGDGTFSEVGQLAGISNTDWSWCPLFADLDGDGNKDLFVTNGYVKDYTDMDFLKYQADMATRGMQIVANGSVSDYISKMPTLQIPNYVFKNDGQGGFVKSTDDWGLNQPGVSAGAAYVDLDNDGDLDLVVNNSNAFASIYKNNSETLQKTHHLRIQLEGNTGNRRGVGTKVKLYSKGKLSMQEQSPVRGFQSSVDPVLNFGLGNQTLVDSILIIWPNDQFQKLTNIKADQTVKVEQRKATALWQYDPSLAKQPAIFYQNSMPVVAVRENDFNDFTVQSLLPNYLSRQGPCLATGDANGDGLDDFFVGGAKDQPGQIFLQSKNGTFHATAQPALTGDAASEDAAAVFFDADSDGDQDLYVASGGYEFNENDAALQDRLYINNGRGEFVRKQNALPDMRSSKGTVKAADVDGDGDPDLFVGGRVVPGKYPLAPESYLLLNDGKGNFTNGTQTICPQLKHLGMVTDAAWVDVNNDKKPDLVVAGEWMPIKVFLNQNGRLPDQSSSYIHFASTGWWNKMKAADMDGDGDLDLVIGNCGANTQFHANEKEPLTIYAKDFDRNGSIDPVFCYYIGGVSYPAASRDDLTDQLPAWKKKFLTYKDYANATINDMFSAGELKDAIVLKAETMQTVYLENAGAKGFVLHALPAEAQYAPVYGIAALDATGDGKKDLLLAGNNTWTRIKFGRYTANHGILLQGDGQGNFAAVPQARTGLKLRGNVRSLSTIRKEGREAVIAGINDVGIIELNTRLK